MVEVTWHEKPREDATASTIAMYKRERAVHPGCLVAVNANYTCYAIRGMQPKPPRAPRWATRCQGTPPTYRPASHCYRQVAWFA